MTKKVPKIAPSPPKKEVLDEKPKTVIKWTLAVRLRSYSQGDNF